MDQLHQPNRIESVRVSVPPILAGDAGPLAATIKVFLLVGGGLTSR